MSAMTAAARQHSVPASGGEGDGQHREVLTWWACTTSTVARMSGDGRERPQLAQRAPVRP
ncbi:MAG: hypothetical protein M3143_08695 [Actinomycetota bacterium]|nr:hypothetical protein [Actinomycetota bacterium]